MTLLEVQNLQTHFRTPEGINRAVDGVSFHVDEGETLAIVGESGCGKSVTAMSLMRLIPEPPGKIAGSVRFQGKDLLQLSEPEMRAIRGNDISMIFQEPMTSLNPVLTVGRQIGETLRMHQGLDKQAALARAIEMLTLVGITEPARRVREYPHQLSGGMRQRHDRGVHSLLHRRRHAAHHSVLGQHHGRGKGAVAGQALHRVLSRRVSVRHRARRQPARRRPA